MDATGPLAGTTLDEFAPLYQACARAFGWSPRVVDQLEIWEVAQVLAGDTTEPNTASTAPAPRLSGRDLLAARVAHAQGRGPKPEAAPMPAESPMLNRMLGG